MTRRNTYLRELPPGLTHIDVYWVLRLFNVTDPCVQHAVKKLLADGSGDKDRATNIREAWETLDRWREMEGESNDTPMTMNDLVRQMAQPAQEPVRAAATKVPGRCPGNGNRDVCVHMCTEQCAVNGMPVGPGGGWNRA